MAQTVTNIIKLSPIHFVSNIHVTERTVLVTKDSFKLTSPTAFDEAGIRMLDSIREVFDILVIEMESVNFDLIEYKSFEELANALNSGKCPVVDVLLEHYLPGKSGSHAMVATGIKNDNGVKYIQMKNSFADNPNEQGKVSLSLNEKTICKFFANL